MVDPLLDHDRRPGPASETFYPDHAASANVEGSGDFRRELSAAFSHTYMLTPHALVHSYYDGLSVWSYKDQRVIDKYSSLYVYPFTPMMDLQMSERSVYQARIQYQQSTTLRPNRYYEKFGKKEFIFLFYHCQTRVTSIRISRF
jgi:hypothetical protein